MNDERLPAFVYAHWTSPEHVNHMARVAAALEEMTGYPVGQVQHFVSEHCRIDRIHDLEECGIWRHYLNAAQTP
jgi:hypothetical protein